MNAVYRLLLVPVVLLALLVLRFQSRRHRGWLQ